MSRHLRLTKASKFGLLLLVALSIPACSAGDDGQTFAFEGIWTYSDGLANCLSPIASYPLRGAAEVKISSLSRSTIEFRANQSCQLLLETDGARARAHAGQTCVMSLGQTTSHATIETFELEAVGDELLNSVTGASKLEIAVLPAPIACAAFNFEGGRLRRTSAVIE
jgi:hypothetical protein